MCIYAYKYTGRDESKSCQISRFLGEKKVNKQRVPEFAVTRTKERRGEERRGERQDATGTRVVEGEGRETKSI